MDARDAFSLQVADLFMQYSLDSAPTNSDQTYSTTHPAEAPHHLSTHSSIPPSPMSTSYPRASWPDSETGAEDQLSSFFLPHLTI